MTSAAQFRKVALSLEGTTRAPHFDRTAFKVKRTYATLTGAEAATSLNRLPPKLPF